MPGLQPVQPPHFLMVHINCHYHHDHPLFKGGGFPQDGPHLPHPVVIALFLAASISIFFDGSSSQPNILSWLPATPTSFDGSGRNTLTTDISHVHETWQGCFFKSPHLSLSEYTTELRHQLSIVAVPISCHAFPLKEERMIWYTTIARRIWTIQTGFIRNFRQVSRHLCTYSYHVYARISHHLGRPNSERRENVSQPTVAVIIEVLWVAHGRLPPEMNQHLRVPLRQCYVLILGGGDSPDPFSIPRWNST